MAWVLTGWYWREGASEADDADIDLKPTLEALRAEIGEAVPLEQIGRIRIRLKNPTPERLEYYRAAGWTVDEVFDA